MYIYNTLYQITVYIYICTQYLVTSTSQILLLKVFTGFPNATSLPASSPLAGLVDSRPTGSPLLPPL